MQKRATAMLGGLAALAILGSGSIVSAQEIPQAARAQEQPAEASGPLSNSAATRNLFRVKPVDETSLAANRGGAQVSDMRLDGVVAENQAVNIGATGTNVINQGAFTNAAGVPMVVQNSGNNVLIQNATIVNVEVK
jgi:hypothetical protein